MRVYIELLSKLAYSTRKKNPDGDEREPEQISPPIIIYTREREEKWRLSRCLQSICNRRHVRRISEEKSDFKSFSHSPQTRAQLRFAARATYSAFVCLACRRD